MVHPGDESSSAGRVAAFIAVALVGAVLLAQYSFWLAGAAVAIALAPVLFAAVRSTRSRLGDVPPTFASDPTAYPSYKREFETLPFANPFSPDSDHLPLAQRITMAAEAAAEYSRGASVLFLATDDDATTQRAYRVMRDALRPSDHVEIVEGGVVACLNLIRDLANVDGVIARLTRRLLEADWPQSNPPRFGRALYPMHGYSGADLIEAARQQVRPATSARNARRVDPSSQARGAQATPPQAAPAQPASARPAPARAHEPQTQAQQRKSRRARGP